MLQDDIPQIKNFWICEWQFCFQFSENNFESYILAAKLPVSFKNFQVAQPYILQSK